MDFMTKLLLLKYAAGPSLTIPPFKPISNPFDFTQSAPNLSSDFSSGGKREVSLVPGRNQIVVDAYPKKPTALERSLGMSEYAFNKMVDSTMDMVKSFGMGSVVKGPLFGGGNVFSTRLPGSSFGSPPATSAGRAFLERLARAKAEGPSFNPTVTRPNAPSTQAGRDALAKLPKR